MAITSSGSLAFAAFNAEFGLGYNLNSYYGCDPYLPVPRSGTIAFNNFYSSDNRTAEITIASSNDGYGGAYGRAGWAEYKGSGFTIGTESTAVLDAFGSVSKNLNLSTGQAVQGLYAADQSSSTLVQRYISLTKRGAGSTSTTAGFSEIRMRFNNVYWRYGDAVPAGQEGTSFTNFEVTLTRANANYFTEIPGSTTSLPAYAFTWVTTSQSGADDVSKAYLAFTAGNPNGYISFKVIY